MNRNTTQTEVLREYGPWPGIDAVHGVTFDGRNIWFARGESIVAVDPESGSQVREIAAAADAGTAFDGSYLWQMTGDRIQKIDPESQQVVATIPAPAKGGDSGLTWAEGTLWVGEYRGRKIHQVDAETGETLRTIESDRFVTGVTWVDGELWHATLEDSASDLRRVDLQSGSPAMSVALSEGILVSGLESDGGDIFYCGGAGAGRLRAVQKPRS